LSQVRQSRRAVEGARGRRAAPLGGVSLAWLDPQRLVLVVFVGAIFAAAAAPLLDPDLWWHLANGRYILGHGIPATDVYSFTAAGHVWVVHEWLADVVMYWLHGRVGLSGLVVLAAAVVAGAALAIQRLLRAGGLGQSSAVLLAGVLALASSPSWGARPQIINLLLAGLLCLLLLGYRRRPGRWVLWLIPGFAVWANLHSAYLFGAGLVVAFAIGETLDARLGGAEARPADRPTPHGGTDRAYLRRLYATGLLGGLAGLATPGTWRTVLFPFGTLGSNTIQSNIQEWLSPDFHGLPGVLLAVAVAVLVGGGLGTLAPERGRRRPAWWLLGALGGAGLVALSPDFHATVPRLLLAAAALAAVAWVLPRQQGGGRAESLWAVATLVLALTSLRHVALFAAAGAPALGRSAATLLAGLGVPPRRSPAPSAVTGAANLVLLALIAAGGAMFVTSRVSPHALDVQLRRVEPVAAVDHMLAAPVPQPLFNFYDYGGYLIWRAGPDSGPGAPAYRVFIDGRVEVYGDALFRRYLDTNYGTIRWRDTLRDYRIRTVLLPTSHPLGRLLVGDGWSVAYRDPTATIYTHGG
jgi:hypothetical protein